VRRSGGERAGKGCEQRKQWPSTHGILTEMTPPRGSAEDVRTEKAERETTLIYQSFHL